MAAGGLNLWAERQGTGPDVLLIAGLGDPAEAWQFQLEGLADRYRLTSFDNRGGLDRTSRPGPPRELLRVRSSFCAELSSAPGK